jgi:hypothetical protein
MISMLGKMISAEAARKPSSVGFVRSASVMVDAI